jgi:hypothetical protein
MRTHNISRYSALGAGLMLIGMASLPADTARASDCSSPAGATSSHDPLRSEGFQVLAAKELYRVQERPFAHVPTGAKLMLRAPAGVTEADLHRAATCGASELSPLSVPGAKLKVIRNGDKYELHVTADSRSAALEIQRRAKAL